MIIEKVEKGFLFVLNKETLKNFDEDSYSNENAFLFNMSKKRVYLSIIDRVIEDLNFVFNQDKTLLEVYIAINNAIFEGVFSSEEELIDAIDECLISNESLLKIIRDKINKEYTITIECARNGSEELQFKDSYAKLIICISMMCRFILPFVCSYMNYTDAKKEANFSINMFTRIFNYFNEDDLGNKVDLAAKISSFISSLVDNTLYSDKIIWEFLKNLSINERILSMDLFRKFIRDTLPKFETNRSAVSFLHSVIRLQIQFTFTQNIKIEYKPVSQIRMENSDSGMTPFSRMESRLVSFDEMQYIIEKEAINKLVEKISSKYSEEEFEYYLSKRCSNDFQIKIVSAYINSLDRINVMLCNKEQFTWLLIETRKWLESKKMFFLSYLLIADIAPKEQQNIKKSFGRSRLVGEILQSVSYRNIINRYSIVKDRLEESKIILTHIGEILSTRFIFVPKFEEKQFNENFVNVEVNQRKIVSELLSFMERF